MAGLPKHGYAITLNDKIVTLIFASGAQANMIMDDMRLEHFEDVFGLELSDKTKTLEEQYEKENRWDYVEHPALSSADAELRCTRIMRKHTAEEL